MLKVDTVSVMFGDTCILKDFSLEVRAGELVAVVGHNGAGKSTLFNVIAGATIPQSGTIWLDGEDITQTLESERALVISRLVQDVTLGSVGQMTVAENLCLASLKGKRVTLRAPNRRFIRELAQDILKPFCLGLEDKLDVPMAYLSGGQRQIIAFIMATLVKPKLLLLDEPTAALDPQSALRLLNFVNEYVKNHGIAALVITHDHAIARDFGTSHVELRRSALE